ncbi:hypothetical protein GCM10022408_33750 [Hymenobacter fastidiosus]|uniref:DUF3108 domain-containing protein n=1 Tax=Hymenobacter fastidiosus TaxID=486264 RepID=A0ABP7SWR6_9BACT
MKHLITILLFATCLTSINAHSGWTLIDKTSIRGSISGSITQGYIFKVDRGFYVINERTRQRVRTRNPEVKIYQNGSDYKLVIEDFDEPVICKKLKNVIETQISGEFKGWEGETIFKMMNGQIWQQSSYAYTYHYAYSPNVLIYEFKGTWTMKVEDVDEAIQVSKLK